MQTGRDDVQEKQICYCLNISGFIPYFKNTNIEHLYNLLLLLYFNPPFTFKFTNIFYRSGQFDPSN